MKCECGKRVTLAESVLGCKHCGATPCATHRPGHTCPKSIESENEKKALRDKKLLDVPKRQRLEKLE